MSTILAYHQIVFIELWSKPIHSIDISPSRSIVFANQLPEIIIIECEIMSFDFFGLFGASGSWMSLTIGRWMPFTLRFCRAGRWRREQGELGKLNHKLSRKSDRTDRTFCSDYILSAIPTISIGSISSAG